MDNIKLNEYYIELALKEINIITEYTKVYSIEDLFTNDLLCDALLFRLIQMNEALQKVTLEFKLEHNNIRWNEISGFRNKIVHDYFKTDYSIVYEIIKYDIPILKQELEDLL